MKYYIIVFFVFGAVGWCFGQTPSNDSNWVQTWGDEFNYTGHPHDTTWRSTAPWGSDVYSKVFVPYDWHHVETNGSFVSILDRVGSYALPISGHTVRKPYTEGEISTLRTFQYGYFEAKIRMPDWDYPSLYGGYHNDAFWLYNQGLSQNVDWSELDFEIIMNSGVYPVIVPPINSMQCNFHMMKPYGERDTFWALTHDSAVYDDPAHFAAFKSTIPVDYADFYQVFDTCSLLFHGGWHIFGYEWLPDQVKLYIDNKLWIRLEGNFPYYYTDVRGNHDTLYPIHNMNVPMPIILDNGMYKYGGDTTASGPDSISMDVDYVRYYQLKENCAAPFIQSGSSGPYYLCGSGYNQTVYDSVALGQTGCATCDVEVGTCYSPLTRVSVRAKHILLQDGFKVSGESEFYAHDVDTCP